MLAGLLEFRVRSGLTGIIKLVKLDPYPATSFNSRAGGAPLNPNKRWQRMSADL